MGLFAAHVQLGGGVRGNLQLMFGWEIAFGVICTSYSGRQRRLGLFVSIVWMRGGVWGNLQLMFGWATAFGVVSKLVRIDVNISSFSNI